MTRYAWRLALCLDLAAVLRCCADQPCGVGEFCVRVPEAFDTWSPDDGWSRSFSRTAGVQVGLQVDDFFGARSDDRAWAQMVSRRGEGSGPEPAPTWIGSTVVVHAPLPLRSSSWQPLLRQEMFERNAAQDGHAMLGVDSVVEDGAVFHHHLRSAHEDVPLWTVPLTTAHSAPWNPTVE